MCSNGPPSKFAEPSICRRYHSARVSSSSSSSVKCRAPSGKWPQKMIMYDHRLRMRLARALAFIVESQAGPDSSG
jgi:hypothetical protein